MAMGRGFPKEPASFALQRPVFLALAAALIPLLALWAYAALELGSARAAAERSAGEGSAARYAGVIGGRVAGLVAQADLLAADPDAAAALAAADPQRIAAAETALTARFPGARRTRLAPVGADLKPDEQMPPTGYAAIDLLDRTESGQRPPVEVHMFGTPSQQLVVARPVPGKNGVAGGVLFSLEVGTLEQWLRGLSGVAGYLELHQLAGDLVLAKAGNAAARQGEPFRAPIDGAAWQVFYWAPAAAEISLTGITVAGGVAVALLAAIMVVLARVLSRLVQNDLFALVRFLLARRGARLQPLRLAEFVRVAVEVERKREGGSRSSLQAQESRSEQSSLGGESDLIFMPKDALVVESVGEEEKEQK